MAETRKQSSVKCRIEGCAEPRVGVGHSLCKDHKADAERALGAEVKAPPGEFPTYGLIALESVELLRRIDASLKTIVAFLPKATTIVIPGVTPPPAEPRKA